MLTQFSILRYVKLTLITALFGRRIKVAWSLAKDLLKILKLSRRINSAFKKITKIGVEPNVNWQHHKNYQYLDLFIGAALTDNIGENSFELLSLYIPEADQKEISGSLFTRGGAQRFKERVVLSVRPDDIFSAVRRRYCPSGEELSVILRLNCEGAETEVIRSALKHFKSDKLCLLGTIVDVEKYRGEHAAQSLESELRSYGLTITPFSPSVTSWLEAMVQIDRFISQQNSISNAK